MQHSVTCILLESTTGVARLCAKYQVCSDIPPKSGCKVIVICSGTTYKITSVFYNILPFMVRSAICPSSQQKGGWTAPCQTYHLLQGVILQHLTCPCNNIQCTRHTGCYSSFTVQFWMIHLTIWATEVTFLR